MFLKIRPLPAVVAGFCLTAAVIYVSAHYFILDSFVQLEEQEMQRNVDRAVSLLGEELDRVNTTCGDYASWDDAYRFVQDRNRTFVADNLAPETYAKLNLSVIAYYDQEGRAVYEGIYDLEQGRVVPFPATLGEHLAHGNALPSFAFPSEGRSGILNLPNGLLLTASRPVITSAYQGPIRGTLVMGRFLTPKVVASIASTLHMPLAILPASGTPLPADFARAQSHLARGQPMFLRTEQTEQTERIYGYAQMTDLSGAPALLLRVDMPRAIYAEGRHAITYFMGWIIICGALAAGVLAWGVQRLSDTRRRIERSEERHRLVVERTDQGILLAGATDRIIQDANPAFCLLVGRSVADLARTSIYHVLEGDRLALDEAIERCQREKREVSLLHRDGTRLIAEMTATSIPGETGDVQCFMFHDISLLRRFQADLLHQATHDVLTGLPNRSLLNDRVERAIAGARRRADMVALLLIDLDHFKVVNDTMGHAVGDLLLQSVAARLRSFVRTSDTITRLGGDEFVILLTNIASMGDIITVAENFGTLLAVPIVIEERDYFVTASVGIAVFPDDGDTIDVLIKKADTAMYNAKESGRNGFQFFADEMNQKVNARLRVETQMRRALERDEMSLQFQPTLDLRTGMISGVEALARWANPTLGVVAPAEFIPVAEDAGLIARIGEWVLDRACRQTRAWHDMGHTSLRVSVNISTRQFIRPDFAERTARIVDGTGLAPQFVDLEITESALTHNVSETITILGRLKSLGLTISIDDFGTGYSSLNYLKRFPIDTLKIDKTFIDDAVDRHEDAAIVSAIIAMAHHMNLRVVAEGVEKAEQIEFLVRKGCEDIQGHLFCKPLDSDSLGDFLAACRKGWPGMSQFRNNGSSSS